MDQSTGVENRKQADYVDLLLDNVFLSRVHNVYILQIQSERAQKKIHNAVRNGRQRYAQFKNDPEFPLKPSSRIFLIVLRCVDEPCFKQVCREDELDQDQVVLERDWNDFLLLVQSAHVE